MGDITFLSLEEVLALHDDAIAFAGGEAGVLSIDMLQSAIAQPEAGFGGQWANTFPFGMAAAYAYHAGTTPSSMATSGSGCRPRSCSST